MVREKLSVDGCGNFVWDNLCCREGFFFFQSEFSVESIKTVEKVQRDAAGSMREEACLN